MLQGFLHIFNKRPGVRLEVAGNDLIWRGCELILQLSHLLISKGNKAEIVYVSECITGIGVWLLQNKMLMIQTRPSPEDLGARMTAG